MRVGKRVSGHGHVRDRGEIASGAMEGFGRTMGGRAERRSGAGTARLRGHRPRSGER
jgi:hypothetical protein